MAKLEKIGTLPKEKLDLLSQHQIDNSKYWFYVLHQGHDYIIPVDKNMHKIINKVGLWDFEKATQSIIDAIYLQVRQRVGDVIETMLSQQIDEGFRKVYSSKLRKKIEGGFNLLEFDDNSKK